MFPPQQPEQHFDPADKDRLSSPRRDAAFGSIAVRILRARSRKALAAPKKRPPIDRVGGRSCKVAHRNALRRHPLEETRPEASTRSKLPASIITPRPSGCGNPILWRISMYKKTQSKTKSRAMPSAKAKGGAGAPKAKGVPFAVAAPPFAKGGAKPKPKSKSSAAKRWRLSGRDEP
jgi:hypothetical protein